MNVKKKYYSIFFVTVFVLLLNQFVIQYYLYQLRHDAKTINAAGYQRMLSQKLLVQFEQIDIDTYEQNERINFPHKLFERWVNAHEGLVLGSPELQIKKISNKEIRNQLSQLGKYIDFIRTINSSTKENFKLEEVRKNQESFLFEMNNIVSRLEVESKEKLKRVVILEIIILLISVCILFYEFRFFIIPISVDLQKKNEDLNEHIEVINDYRVSNQRLSKFSNLLLSDLKTPISKINSITKELFQSFKEEELNLNQLDNMKLISDASNELYNMVDDLGKIVALEERELNLEELNCKALLDDIISGLTDDLEAINGKITCNMIPLSMTADKNKLKVIFENLISNAIKFSKNDVPLNLIIDCNENQNSLQFVIMDNGIGIEESNLENIFEIFKRVNPHKTNQGSGSGLSIAKKAINICKGEINVTSIIGDGTIFYIKLPKYKT